MINFILNNFDTIFKNETSLETLDKLILDLAIRGKLVEQDPNDEPASELIKRIKAEKEQLIKEKIVKKEKPLPPIEEDEIPFDIPNSWEWVRLGKVSNIVRGGSPRPINLYLTTEADGINWIKIGDTEKNGKYINSAKEKIKKEGMNKSRLVKKGDFLLTNSMSFGRPYISNIEGCVHDGWLIISNYENNYDINFLYYLLSSNFTYLQFSKNVSGSVVKNLNIEKVISSIFPLPPLKEQKRIVSKIEKLQFIIKGLKEIYIKNQNNRENLKKSLLSEIENQSNDKDLLKNLEIIFINFGKIIKTKEDIKDIRNLILSLAIKGKLVEQDQNDEPASELLKRIKGEKERLIKEKIIKKEKPLPPIKEDEIPFDIPSSWKWVRLGELGNIFNGNSINEKVKKEKYENLIEGLNYIATKDINYPTSIINYNNGIKIPFKELEKFKIAHKNSVLICSEGGSAGKKIGITEEDICFGNKLYAFESFSKELNNKYIFYIYNSNYFYKNFKDNETGIIGGVSVNKFKNIEIPLPPIEEQKRIVSKIESLMKICDSLEEKITLNEKISEKLLESILKN